jgi:DtxR family Mn-dependent transcriptional regulator
MLGRPSVDPHGDPIPDAEGAVTEVSGMNLMSAPVGTALLVTRVVDQNPEFLRFVEQHDLVPGRRLVIAERDPASDAVRLRSPDGKDTAIGTRAASKVLVKLNNEEPS